MSSVDEYQVNKWVWTIRNRKDQKDAIKARKLPFLFYLILIPLILVSILLIPFLMEAVVRTVDAGHALDWETLRQSPSEVIQATLEASTMETKETFDREAYPLIVPDSLRWSSEYNKESEERTYRGDNLFDGTLSRVWQADRKEEGGDTARIWMMFMEPQEISAIGIWAGNQKSREAYYANSRPATIWLRFTTADDYECEYEIHLDDEPIEQILRLGKPIDVTSIECEIESVFEGEHRNMIVSELALYGTIEGGNE